MLLFKGFFVSLQSTRGLVSSNNFYYCRSRTIAWKTSGLVSSNNFYYCRLAGIGNHEKARLVSSNNFYYCR